MKRKELIDKLDVTLAVLNSGNIETGKALLKVLRDIIESEEV